MSISDTTTLNWSPNKPLNPKEGDVYFDTQMESVMTFYSNSWYAMMQFGETEKRLKLSEDRGIKLTEILGDAN